MAAAARTPPGAAGTPVTGGVSGGRGALDPPSRRARPRPDGRSAPGFAPARPVPAPTAALGTGGAGSGGRAPGSVRTALPVPTRGARPRREKPGPRGGRSALRHRESPGTASSRGALSFPLLSPPVHPGGLGRPRHAAPGPPVAPPHPGGPSRGRAGAATAESRCSRSPEQRKLEGKKRATNARVRAGSGRPEGAPGRRPGPAGAIRGARGDERIGSAPKKTRNNIKKIARATLKRRKKPREKSTKLKRNERKREEGTQKRPRLSPHRPAPPRGSPPPYARSAGPAGPPRRCPVAHGVLSAAGSPLPCHSLGLFVVWVWGFCFFKQTFIHSRSLPLSLFPPPRPSPASR
eukprot:XP_025007899.1 collagen alpha-1(I) chain-like [Gallus gallus]